MKANILMWSYLVHFFFRTKNVETRAVEKIETHIYVQWLFPENLIFCEMCKNTVNLDWPQMTIWRMRVPCWITRSINTQPEYVIIIVFPLQQWLRKRVSVFCYTCSACIVRHIGDSRVRHTLFGTDMYLILCKVLAAHNTFFYDEMMECVVEPFRRNTATASVLSECWELWILQRER